MAKQKREGAAIWRKRIRRWRQSGLSRKEFAAREGTSARSLSWWAWKLDKDETVASEPTTPGFVPVRVVSQASGPERAEALEVTMPGGAQIRIPQRFDAQALARVIAVLEGPR